MSNEKSLEQEFIFIRDKLQTIARLLVEGERNNLIEASFMIGCLHNVCHQNSIIFKDNECKTDLHDR